MTDAGERYSKEWIDQVRETQALVAMSHEDIVETNTEWEELSRSANEDDTDDQKILDALRPSLTEQQQEAVRSLLEISADVPYGEMLEFLRYREERVAAAEHKLAEKALEIAAQQENQSPGQGAAERQSGEQAALETELSTAAVDLEEAHDLFMETGEAWPVPRLVAIDYAPAENEIVIVEQMPNERERTSEAIVERVRARNRTSSQPKDDSEYFGMLLTDTPGHIWTSRELGEALYPEDDSIRNKRAKLSALIVRYRHQDAARTAELLDGRALQKGRRVAYNMETGALVPTADRIVWRTADKETAEKAETVTTINKNEGILQTYIEWESITSGVEADVSKKEHGHEAPRHSESKSGRDAKNKETAKSDWKQAFAAEVDDAIRRYAALGLMASPELQWKTLRIKTPSGKVGTETARERAVDNKIVKARQSSDESVITVSQAILSELLNTNPEIFNIKSRRKMATQIAERAVTQYFKSREKNQS